jgi:hypothetical protein
LFLLCDFAFYYLFELQGWFSTSRIVLKEATTKELNESMINSIKKYESVRTNLQSTIHQRRCQILKDQQEQDKKDDDDTTKNDADMEEGGKNADIVKVLLKDRDSNGDKNRSLVIEDQRIKERKDELMSILALDYDGRFDNKWTKIIQSKTEQLNTKTERIRRQNDILARIVLGYKSMNADNLTGNTIPSSTTQTNSDNPISFE